MEEQKKEEFGTVTFKKSTLWKVGTFVFAILFVITLGHDFWETDTSGGVGNVVAPVQGGDPSEPTPSNINVKIDNDDPILGDKDAPITIVEFSDFQCPFCARAANDAVAQLKNNEIKNGEVKFVYKDFPLRSIHQFAQGAGEAAQCAHQQGKFWEYHDKLFENQGALGDTDLKKYAEEVGLDTGKFNDCFDGGDTKSEVDSDYNQATAAGGRGTPYFVIDCGDGKTIPLSGALPYAQFQAAISSC